MDGIETFFGWLGGLSVGLFPIHCLTVWWWTGLLRAGGVVVFLPQIFNSVLLYLGMEESGYLPVPRFWDKLMFKAGLSGRAFIPLLSSFACAIPGIMASRTISDPRDRLTTILWHR